MKLNLNRFFYIALVIILSQFLIADQKKIPQQVDISINSIYLDNPQSVLTILGNKISVSELSEYQYNEYTNMPHAIYCNADSTQILYLIQHPGSEANCFSQFIVTQNSEEIREEFTCLKAVKEFKTGKSIKLGMEKQELIQILGDDFEKIEKNGNTTILNYSITNFDSNEFLQDYNMPFYSGKYTFQDGVLSEFSFGFKYP